LPEILAVPRSISGLFGDAIDFTRAIGLNLLSYGKAGVRVTVLAGSLSRDRGRIDPRTNGETEQYRRCFRQSYAGNWVMTE
jgi:hypothetical protein